MNIVDADEVLQTSGDNSAQEKCQAKEQSETPIEPQPLEHQVGVNEDQTNKQPELKSDNPDLPASGSEAKADHATENAEEPVVAVETTPNPTSSVPVPVPTETKEVVNDKKKEDDKLSIYKALAIKLKKELVKSRDELQKLREDSSSECSALKQKVKDLETSLEAIQQSSATTTITLESKVKSLKERLDNSELDLQNLQNEFESYKVRASKIMQQNNSAHQASNKTFEDDRYKQLKELNDEQAKRISTLESQLSAGLNRNRELEKDGKLFQEELELLKEKLKTMTTLDDKCETLSRENENLKLALKQFRTKLKEPIATTNQLARNSPQAYDEYSNRNRDLLVGSEGVETTKKLHDNNFVQTTASNTNLEACQENSPSTDNLDQQDDNVIRISPSASVKDDSQTNSSSSYDGSTSGYVHIKPATFEIISRSSVLEDAQNQIDNLTKAYLDSENTNSLLSDQVRALKEEIRRLQRGTERMDLAENLEYLKNVVFKFISLDSGQVEQKQRLVPVLSTVLKLSPDETAKLNSLAIADKPRMASSFFKL